MGIALADAFDLWGMEAVDLPAPLVLPLLQHPAGKVQVLAAREIKACIPPRRNRNTLHSFDRQIYETRHKIENMFGRLKERRRISTRFDRCAHTFFSVICIAAAFIFYLNK